MVEDILILAPLSVDSVPLPIAEADRHAGPDRRSPKASTPDVEDDADDVRITAAAAAVLAPMASPRVGPDEEVLFDGEPVAQPLFEVETPSPRADPARSAGRPRRPHVLALVRRDLVARQCRRRCAPASRSG